MNAPDLAFEKWLAKTLAQDALIAAPYPATREEARMSGSKFFATGLPCRNGHVVKRTVSDGHCTACAYLNCRKRRLSDPVAHAQRTQAWNAANPEKKKKSDRKWLDSNKAVGARNRRRWYLANKGKARKSVVAWNSRNPEKVRAYCERRRARERNAVGQFSGDDIERIRRSQRNKCACCRASLGEKYHIDHITPIAAGGTNWASNIQLLCRPCNQSKGAKDPIEFMQSRGRLL